MQTYMSHMYMSQVSASFSAMPLQPNLVFVNGMKVYLNGQGKLNMAGTFGSEVLLRGMWHSCTHAPCVHAQLLANWVPKLHPPL